MKSVNRIDLRLHHFDEAEKDGEQTARPIGAFHRKLIEMGVSEETAKHLTFLYTRKVLKV